MESGLILKTLLMMVLMIEMVMAESDDQVLQLRLKAGKPLSKEELEKAARLPLLKAQPTSDAADPMIVPGAFEGDIDGVNVPDLLVKNAIISPSERWPGGIIPYIIGAEYNGEERLRIAQAILEFHSKTCIRFVPRRRQQDHLFLHKGRGCMSQVGRKGGRQLITLGDGCVFPGIVIHELLHAVGFWHEQSRADRDNYVQVHWNNIAPGMEFNFLKYTWGEIQGLGEPYDLSSVMHYASNAFSRNGFAPTLVSRQPARIGQRDGFSTIDLNKVNKLYDCARNTGRPVSLQCVDHHPECKSWQMKGECNSNILWMSVNCRASCGSCSELDLCVDQHRTCGAWAFLWQCQVNPQYMLNFCRKSCRMCRSSTIIGPEKSANATNNSTISS